MEKKFRRNGCVERTVLCSDDILSVLGLFCDSVQSVWFLSDVHKLAVIQMESAETACMKFHGIADIEGES